ncbi:MAG: hypothetical protein U9Q03_06440 [Patescibacteria group bacterium]|nr:hypothetical protein [Patescibacteria group bacterium]
MGEKMTFESGARQEDRESVEKKKERLQPVLKQSMEVFRNPDRPLNEGALTVTRELGGETETLQGLVILEVFDDAIEMGCIEDDGEIGASAFMTWEELVDVTKS